MLAKLIAWIAFLGKLKDPPTAEKLLASHPDHQKKVESIADLEKRIECAARKKRKE